MKHLCIIAAAILLACCQAKAGSETMNMTEGDTLYTWNLQEHIKDQPISVPRGGDTPDIVTLLTAFNHAYPTGDLSYLLGLANDPKFTRSEENEYGGYDVIDRKNGYAGTDITSGADGSYMDAALWRRNDGHRLLILHFGQPTDPEIDYVICYDYDPCSPCGRRTSSSSACRSRARTSRCVNTHPHGGPTSSTPTPGTASTTSSHTRNPIFSKS